MITSAEVENRKRCGAIHQALTEGRASIHRKCHASSRCARGRILSSHCNRHYSVCPIRNGGRGNGSTGSCGLDCLRQKRGRASAEVGVAAVNRSNAMGADRESRSLQLRAEYSSNVRQCQRTAEIYPAILKLHGAGRNTGGNCNRTGKGHLLT